MARETVADLREQRDNAIERARRAEHELIRLKALVSVMREIVAEIDRIEGQGA